MGATLQIPLNLQATNLKMNRPEVETKKLARKMERVVRILIRLTAILPRKSQVNLEKETDSKARAMNLATVTLAIRIKPTKPGHPALAAASRLASSLQKVDNLIQEVYLKKAVSQMEGNSKPANPIKTQNRQAGRQALKQKQ